MPPRMIPDIDPATIENLGERMMYRLLREQLPEDWAVRHHYPFTFNKEGRLRDGESDFIVSAPGLGLLFIETKGSHGVVCEAGKWFHIDREGRQRPARDPFDQVKDTKHAVVRMLAQRTGRPVFPGAYGHCVAYPQGALHGSLPCSQDRRTLITAEDAADIVGRIREALGMWGDEARRRRYDSGVHDEIVGILGDSSRILVRTATRIAQDEEDIALLTTNQFAFFKGLLNFRRLRVEGPAGSGKTMMALMGMEAFLDQGRECLFLCYNKGLAAWLALRQPRLAARIKTFHQLCRAVSGTAFIPPVDSEARATFWRDEAPRTMLDCLSDSEFAGRFDVVLVDEAQDFHGNWWTPIQLLLKDPDRGGLMMFLDPAQRGVYAAEASYPSAGFERYTLPHNCRNTMAIVGYCGRVIDKDIKTPPGCPRGHPPAIDGPWATSQERATATMKAVVGFLQQGVEPKQVAVLSPWAIDNPSCCFRHLKPVKRVPFLTGTGVIEGWMNNAGFMASTIKAFKGLEADCIVVTDLPTELASVGWSELYVATSRARHQLHLIPCSVGAAEKLAVFLRP